jgi:hypothetical protein
MIAKSPTSWDSPIEIIGTFSTLLAIAPQSTTSAVSLADLLPPSTDIDLSLDSMQLSSPISALSILDPLILSSPDEDDSPASDPVGMDQDNLSQYARTILAILEISARDHSWIRKNLWTLPHLLISSEISQDTLALSPPHELNSGRIFGAEIEIDLLRRIGLASEGLGNYTLSMSSNLLEKGWHASAVTRLRSSTPIKSNGTTATTLLDVLDGLYKKSSGTEMVYQRRAFVKILEACLKYGDDDSGVADAERWLALAMNLEEGQSIVSFSSSLEGETNVFLQQVQKLRE